MSLKDLRDRFSDWAFGPSLHISTDADVWSPKLNARIHREVSVGRELVNYPNRYCEIIEEVNEMPLKNKYIVEIQPGDAILPIYEHVGEEKKDQIIKDFQENGSFTIDDLIHQCKRTYEPEGLAVFTSDQFFMKQAVIKKKKTAD